jgi:hypothetical protein
MASADDRRLRAIESKLRQHQVNISELFGTIKELERRVARLESKGDSPAMKKGPIPSRTKNAAQSGKVFFG